MISSIILNFKYTFNKKAKRTVFIYFILLAFFQAIKLNQNFLDHKVKGNLFDYILYTTGGMESPTTFSFIISWILTTLIMVYMSASVVSSMSKLALLSLNRIQSRFKFWIIVCINQLWLSIRLFIVLFMILFIIGSISFDIDLIYSEYTKLFYKEWYSQSLINTIAFIFIIFTSGMYALQIIVQVSLLAFESKFNLFIVYLMISITTGLLYLYNKIPRILSPLFYSSTLSLHKKDIGNALLLNISVSITGIIIGYLIFRRKDLK